MGGICKNVSRCTAGVTCPLTSGQGNACTVLALGKKKKDPIGAFGVLDPGKAAELAGEKNRQLATISWWGKFVKSWSYLGGNRRSFLGG